MITFKQFITENRVDFLKSLFLPKYNNDNHKVDQIISIDPTPNKVYAQWLLNLGLRDPRVIEDGERIKNDLILFDKVKSKLDPNKRDINRLRSQSDLFASIEPFSDFKSGKELKADEKDQIRKDVVVVYKGPEGSIEIPRTQEASCFLGRGTRWCTAANKDNMFDGYNDRGPLYIINTRDGSKYQFHLQSAQLMDARDDKVKFKDFDTKYPWVFNKIHFSQQQETSAIQNNARSIEYIKNPSEQAQMAAVQYDGLLIRYIRKPSEQVQLAAVKNSGQSIAFISDKPSEKVQLAAVQSSPVAISSITEPSEKVQMAAVQYMEFALAYIKNPTERVLLTAVKRSPTALQYINNPSEEVLLAAVQADGRALKYIKKPTEKVQLAAVHNRPDSFKYIKRPYKSVVDYVKGIQ